MINREKIIKIIQDTSEFYRSGKNQKEDWDNCIKSIFFDYLGWWGIRKEWAEKKTDQILAEIEKEKPFILPQWGWVKVDNIICKHCKEIVEENVRHQATSTGRYFRCLKCKTDVIIDETDKPTNSKRWKYFEDNFKLTT